MTVYLKTGDTRTPVAATLKTPKGALVNLEGADVRFCMAPTRRNYLSQISTNGAALIDREATILDAAAGRIAFVFEDGETDHAGTFHGEFKVTYPDGRLERFPNSGYILIQISNSLD